mmetsp:Transcript_13268/g.30623  ORF Transcript_13268/g.30623 Transcript_13268/m.30623 type:complete len:91 (+) Transcript_13268:1300-1572(+)
MHPAKDSTSGIFSFAGRFQLLLGAQQKKSAHFQYNSTLLVEHQKSRKRPSNKKMRISRAHKIHVISMPVLFLSHLHFLFKTRKIYIAACC